MRTPARRSCRQGETDRQAGVGGVWTGCQCCPDFRARRLPLCVIIQCCCCQLRQKQPHGAPGSFPHTLGAGKRASNCSSMAADRSTAVMSATPLACRCGMRQPVPAPTSSRRVSGPSPGMSPTISASLCRQADNTALCASTALQTLDQPRSIAVVNVACRQRCARVSSPARFLLAGALQST